MIWRGRRFEFTFPRPVLVIGVVNVTPDSFYDGGRWLDPRVAVEHGLRLVAEGADILDVGGESTRPGAEPVDEREELKRVLPVIRRLSESSGRPISVDTRKPAVAVAALEAGASIVNDIGAGHNGAAMWEVVAATGAGYVLMHMLGEPATMQEDPRYLDVASEVARFFAERLQGLVSAGVRSEQVALDPGFGFGKTTEHNLDLLVRWPALTKLQRPVIAGVSRKSFIGRVTGAPPGERLPGSLASGLWAARLGAAAVRVHDVAASVQALRMQEAVMARGEAK